MPKQAAIPLPVELVCFHPAMQFTSGAAYRATLAICAAYWLAECPAPAMADMNLATLGRMNIAQWRHVKSEVMPALAALLPALASTYRNCHASRARKAQQARRAGKAGHDAMRRAQSAAMATKPEKVLTDTPSPADAHRQPTRAPEYHNPATAMPPRTLAKIGAATNAARSAGQELARLRDE